MQHGQGTQRLHTEQIPTPDPAGTVQGNSYAMKHEATYMLLFIGTSNSIFCVLVSVNLLSMWHGGSPQICTLPAQPVQEANE